MWVSRFDNWHKDVTPLEKFLAERIIQRCDYSEVISNKHRTANGFTQLKELIQLCALSHKRSRTVKTLIVLLEEASLKNFKQNIVSDFIINKYFIDLRDFIKSVNTTKLLSDKNQPNLTELNRLQHQLKVFEIQLNDHYFEALKKEFIEIKYCGTEKYQTRADHVSTLVDLLVPFLLFKGYSIASIREVLISWLIHGYRFTAKRILDFFHLKIRPFYFLQYLGEKSTEVNNFIDLARKIIGPSVVEIMANDLGNIFTHKYGLGDDDVFVSYNVDALDPHNHVRSNYDFLLKEVVLKKERQSLMIFNDFFEHSFWSHTPVKKIRNLNQIALNGDPINVSHRGRTFRTTLANSALSFGYDFSDGTDIPTPKNAPLRNAVYYYNLALGSKSIENSLSLLWTTLESIIPYRISGTDIECVQHTLVKGIGIGSVARDVYGFALRFIIQNKTNESSLADLGTIGFNPIESPEGLTQWFNWLSDSQDVTQKFTKIKKCSELLAYQYSALGKPYAQNNLELLLDRIQSSKNSIQYQLQRIYLHRNQIVHAGDLVNEYSNLWMHLEWYVGKLLAYYFIQIHFLQRNDSFEEAFRELEADHDYLMSYLRMNKSKKISECSQRIKEMFFTHSWQSY